MFSKLLLVLGVAFSCGTGLTLKANKVSHTPNYSVRYERDKQYGSTVLTNLVYNWDLLRDFDGDNIPDYGFALQGIVNNMSLDNGVWSYETIGGYRGIRYALDLIVGNQYYIFGKGKTTLSNTNLYVEYDNRVEVPVGDTMQFFSKAFTLEASRSYLYVLDNRVNLSPTNTTYIDYLGVIDLTATFGAGNEFSKEQLDSIIEFGYVSGCRQGYDDGYTDGYHAGDEWGYRDGYADGYYDGHEDGYTDGYHDGDEWGYRDGYGEGYYDGYDIGFADAEVIADGSWLGSLVFGTVGGIVGFLFALSDFEVLGVSIMSIITLFVAIGIVKLLLKVLR